MAGNNKVDLTMNGKVIGTASIDENGMILAEIENAEDFNKIVGYNDINYVSVYAAPVKETTSYYEEPITAGYEWSVVDVSSEADLLRVSDWTCSDPEALARDFYEAYPRSAVLYRRKVVKYDREPIKKPAHWISGDQDETAENDAG